MELQLLLPVHLLRSEPHFLLAAEQPFSGGRKHEKVRQ